MYLIFKEPDAEDKLFPKSYMSNGSVVKNSSYLTANCSEKYD